MLEGFRVGSVHVIWDDRRDFWLCRFELVFGSRLLENRVQFFNDSSFDRLSDSVQIENGSDSLEGFSDRFIFDRLPVGLIAWALHGSRIEDVNHRAKSSGFALTAF